VAAPANYLFRFQDRTTVAAAVQAELARGIGHRAVGSVRSLSVKGSRRGSRASGPVRRKHTHSHRQHRKHRPAAGGAAAFRDVASARADSARIVNEAQGYANDVIPKARGETEQMTEAATAYKETKINEPAGEHLVSS
jgi:membrane protease subunit HflK